MLVYFKGLQIRDIFMDLNLIEQGENLLTGGIRKILNRIKGTCFLPWEVPICDCYKCRVSEK